MHRNGEVQHRFKVKLMIVDVHYTKVIFVLDHHTGWYRILGPEILKLEGADIRVMLKA